MSKFRKKPVVIEAEFFDADKKTRLSKPFRAAICNCTSKIGEPQPWHIHTLEGAMDLRDGDWIIRGVAGEFYPCKPDIFEATYEPVLSRAGMSLRDEIMAAASGPGYEELRAGLERAAEEEEAVRAAFPTWFGAVELTLSMYRRRLAHVEQERDDWKAEAWNRSPVWPRVVLSRADGAAQQAETEAGR